MKRGLIDQVEFKVWAGNGGRGVGHFRREKYIRKGGPDGGDGGNGGSIYFLTNPHMTTLMDYAGKTRFEAKSGGSGKGRKQHGEDADDLVLEVPVGTVVYQKNSNDKLQTSNSTEEWEKLFDLDKPNEKALIAQGGAGGRGNTAFKSSVNTTPMESEPGGHGERKELKLEMKILADVGLVGLPNAGKSTLLSVLTAARPEIANYPFTTVMPNLGVLESRIRNQESGIENHDSLFVNRKSQLIIADIPGLIEDAHKGKGLGIDFLRHIERCKMLVYVIAPTDEDLIEMTNDKDTNSQINNKLLITSLKKQLETVQHEVREYGQGVIEKPSLVVVNKMDLLSPKQRAELPKDWIQLSAATTEGIEDLRKKIIVI